MIRAFACAAACCALLTSVPRGASPGDNQLLSDANAAWDAGDYTGALIRYRQLLASREAEAFLETIALQTGELYVSTELTANGAAPQFSPDGRLISYETGTGIERRTLLVPAADPRTRTNELRGFAASFTPDGSGVVYLRYRSSPALAETATAWRGPPAAERAVRHSALDEGLAASAELVYRDLARGAEITLDTGGLELSTPRAAGGGLVLLATRRMGQESEPAQIYAVRAGGPPQRVTEGDEEKTLIDVAAGGGAALIGIRPRGPTGANPGAISFGLLTLPAGGWRTIEGSAPSLAADGRSLVYLAEGDDEHRIVVASVAEPDATSVARSGRERVAAPSLSPDGSLVGFQMMPLHDWEIYVVGRNGQGERRVTREIQHDVLPRFLSAGRLLAAVGEPRHRRSFLHELGAPDRPTVSRRLFHNNTVRTIAPEYGWTPSPDGSRVLISAERDGDTVSPERGVYLVDLTRRVTVEELKRRIDANLAAEEALVAKGMRMFAPIAERVQRIVAAASPARVYAHEKTLFDLDSKHITRPGNRRAAEYLFEAYRSFGYSPEYQTFESRSAHGGATSNVIATLTGTRNPELVYVVSSHYDSVAGGPGADDNSSGTAALLETARLLAGHPQAATIVFASLTGEESGLLGSREFVRRAQEAGTRIAGALNNDMIGWTNDHRLDNTIRYSNRGLRDVQHAAAKQFSRLITYDALYYKGTDAAAYYEAYGDIVGGIGSYPVLGNPHYHQPHDVLETINHQLVTEVAKTTAATLVLLASSPSRLTDLKVRTAGSGTSIVSWSPAREAGITGYVVEYEPRAGGTRQILVRTTAAGVDAPAGAVIRVRAVNETGLESWDSATIAIP